MVYQQYQQIGYIFTISDYIVNSIKYLVHAMILYMKID